MIIPLHGIRNSVLVWRYFQFSSLTRWRGVRLWASLSSSGKSSCMSLSSLAGLLSRTAWWTAPRVAANSSSSSVSVSTLNTDLGLAGGQPRSHRRHLWWESSGDSGSCALTLSTAPLARAANMLVIERTMELVRLVRIIWIKRSYHGNRHNRSVTLYHTTVGILVHSVNTSI